MTDAEINRANLAAFLTRCIAHGWNHAIDAEHGLRITNVVNEGVHGVQIDFEGGHVVTLTLTHTVPRRVPATASHGKAADARPGNH